MASMDFSTYNNLKTAFKKQRGVGLAQNAYKRFLTTQRGNRNAFNIGQKYEQVVPSTISQFVRRNLAGPNVMSGLYERGLTDVANRKTEEMSANQQELNQTLQQLGFSDAEINAEYQRRMAELEASKNAQIANTAAILSSYKSYL